MNNELSNVNLIGLRIGHHASLSGYDQLINRINTNSIVMSPKISFMQRAMAKSMKSFIKNSGSLWYQRDNFIAELSIAKKWMLSKAQVFHFLYGENSYRYSGLLKGLHKNNFLVCTYHTPPSRFKEVVKSRKFLNNLDAVIVVSTMQQDFFSELVGPERVFYVPHGIDTKYFSPLDEVKNNDFLNCLCVGSHLRDYETLDKAAEILAKRTDKIKITVVASSKSNSKLPKSNNIELLSGVSDEKLLMLYRSADLQLLPLLDCTANNSLLEGMACGLPIITTNLPGTKDYVDDACGLFVERRNAQVLADTVLEVFEGNIDLRSMGINSRARAMLFDWQKIVGQLDSLYNNLGK